MNLINTKWNAALVHLNSTIRVNGVSRTANPRFTCIHSCASVIISLMENMAWSKTFELEIPEMDHEHKELLSKMRTIHHLNKLSTSKEKLLAAFDSLVKFTEEHFAHEESVMKEMDYPNIESHLDLHKDMIHKLHTYRDEFTHSVYSYFPESVFDFFQNWLLTHILIVDKRYGEFKKQH